MEEILQPLRLAVYLIIYRVLAPSPVVQDFFHQQYQWQIIIHQPESKSTYEMTS